MLLSKIIPINKFKSLKRKDNLPAHHPRRTAASVVRHLLAAATSVEDREKTGGDGSEQPLPRLRSRVVSPGRLFIVGCPQRRWELEILGKLSCSRHTTSFFFLLVRYALSCGIAILIHILDSVALLRS